VLSLKVLSDLGAKRVLELLHFLVAVAEVDLAIECVQPSRAERGGKGMSTRERGVHRRGQPGRHAHRVRAAAAEVQRSVRARCCGGGALGFAKATGHHLFSAAATSRSDDPLSRLTCCRATGFDTSASMDCRALGVVDAIFTPAAANRPSLQSTGREFLPASAPSGKG
jgi:hypothetical protein